MNQVFYLMIFISVILLSPFSSAQDIPAIDPEAMKLLQQVQKQNQNIPAEMLALMPSELKITEKNWIVEPTTNSLLQLNLSSKEISIILTSYNLKSTVGKITADQSLELQRKEAREEWLNLHPQKQEDYKVFSEPEKIDVPKGKIYLQKLFCKAHNEGEGMVPESTSYIGFLYLEVTNGWLKAEINGIHNSKIDIEKWLKYIAEKTSNLNLDKYFE